jgi:DNA-binding CsgD family transcriptional regulator
MRSTENGNAICGEGLLGATRCFFAPIEDSEKLPGVPGPTNGSESCIHNWLCAGLRSYDLLGVGLVVCDPECHVLGANRCANVLFEAADGLRLSDEGKLLVTPGDDLTAPKSLSEAIDRARLRQKDVAILVKRSESKPAVTLIVKAGAHTPRETSARSPLTLLLLIDPFLPQDSRVSVLQHRYGFSPEESRLANLLAGGLSLEECCDELAISDSRVRRQLASLLRKSGAQCESELIALLNRGSNGDLI